jgi:nicotinic acid mononucleotide adenylyltransferase
MYRVWANDTNGNFYVWQDWQTWVSNTPLAVPINRSSLGIFNYTIEYYDNYNQYGIPETVTVEIVDYIPFSNHPNPITTSKTGDETIDWVLTDDVGGGMFRVWANDTNGNFYVWQDWQTWVSNTPLAVPINRSSLGIFNYTIEYYDDNNQFGNPNTVIVIIASDPIDNEDLAISFGYYYVAFMMISVLSLMILKKRKITKN